MAELNGLCAPVWLPETAAPDAFPPVETALTEPNGLLAIGGDLSVPRLLWAYRRGIFPWYGDDQPILWWAPDPRAVIFPAELHVPRRLRRWLRHHPFEVTVNRAFAAVVECCSMPRPGQPGTWITLEMRAAYQRLHDLGHACSVECWRDGRLAGGVYGVILGRVFFGESMFSRETNASKAALMRLGGLGFALIDCQVPNPHLERLGARLIERSRFVTALQSLCDEPRPDLPRAG